MAVVVAALLLGGAGTGIALKVRHDRQEERDAVAQAKAESLRQTAADEAEATRLAEEDRQAREAAKRAKDKAERQYRQSAIGELEESITKDGKERVADGELDGPILYTSCDPLGGGSVDDLTALTTTFDCIAVSEEVGGGQVRGYGFDATMNWDEGSYTWQLTG
ncbi:MAG: hypothetical protein Q7J48_00635 [Nocardioides sp.]|nr:hypothetical protein [Nocardioides sp.]